MATVTLKLDRIRRGDFIFWTVCTQSYFYADIVISDDQRIYARMSKQKRSPELQVLEQSFSTYTGAPGLQVEINIPESESIMISDHDQMPITDNTAAEIGYCYNFCIEDGTDRDFNDIYINIVAWKNRG